VNRTSRPNTWLHRPTCPRTAFAAVHEVCLWHVAPIRCGANFGRDRSKADMPRLIQD
jgi:hypothetical protein